MAISNLKSYFYVVSIVLFSPQYVNLSVTWYGEVLSFLLLGSMGGKIHVIFDQCGREVVFS